MSNFRASAKHEMISFRLQEAERAKAERVAGTLTNGSLSGLFRWFLSNVPELTSDQPDKGEPNFGQNEAARRTT